MYDENIARIAVIRAAVISIARLLLIALVVCSIGRLTTTAPARSPALVMTQCSPSAAGRDRWLSMDAYRLVLAVAVHQAGRLEEDGLDVLIFLLAVAVIVSPMIGVPSAKASTSRRRSPALRRSFCWAA